MLSERLTGQRSSASTLPSGPLPEDAFAHGAIYRCGHPFQACLTLYVPASTGHRRWTWTVSTWQRWSLWGCALNAAVWLGAMTYAAGGPQEFLIGADGATALLLIWPLVPSVLMAGVTVLASGAPRSGPAVAAVAVALLLAASVTSVLAVLTSDSSTAGLGSFSLPLFGLGIAALSGLTVVALQDPLSSHRRARRRFVVSEALTGQRSLGPNGGRNTPRHQGC